MIVKIWSFKFKCYSCSKKMDAAWPEDLDLEIEEIGEYLGHKQYCIVKRVFSRAMNQEVWGNVCPSCNAYQGNQFIRVACMDVRYNPGNPPEYGRIIESPDIQLTCGRCGRKTDDLQIMCSNYILCPECFRIELSMDK